MAESRTRETAKIYQFPIRGRATEADRSYGARKAAELATSRVAYAECGSSWYHEAALRDAESSHRR